jgi:Flp pilus assembly secretin CpaC
LGKIIFAAYASNSTGACQMLKLLGVMTALIIAAPASAEQPDRVLPEASLAIGVGRSETFRFKSTFDNINVSNKGIVQATAQSDHVMTLFGEAEGGAVVTVRDGGRILYTVEIQITPEVGHIVRMYGRPGVTDYVGFYCTEISCGRADKEFNGSREPTRSIQTIINR